MNQVRSYVRPPESLNISLVGNGLLTLRIKCWLNSPTPLLFFFVPLYLRLSSGKVNMQCCNGLLCKDTNWSQWPLTYRAIGHERKVHRVDTVYILIEVYVVLKKFISKILNGNSLNFLPTARSFFISSRFKYSLCLIFCVILETNSFWGIKINNDNANKDVD